MSEARREAGFGVFGGMGGFPTFRAVSRRNERVTETTRKLAPLP